MHYGDDDPPDVKMVDTAEETSRGLQKSPSRWEVGRQTLYLCLPIVIMRRMQKVVR